jgi:hypothetical protein
MDLWKFYICPSAKADGNIYMERGHPARIKCGRDARVPCKVALRASGHGTPCPYISPDGNTYDESATATGRTDGKQKVNRQEDRMFIECFGYYGMVLDEVLVRRGDSKMLCNSLYYNMLYV